MNDVSSRSDAKPFIYMFIAATSIAISSFFAKLSMVNAIPLSTIVFARFSVPFLILVVIVMFIKSIPDFSWGNMKTHVLRAFFLTISQILLFLAIRKLSLSEAMLLYSTAPIFITLYDLLTGKSITKMGMLGLIISSIGVCLILNIQNGVINFAVLIGLASGLCVSASQILLHKGARKSSPLHVMFFVYLFTSIFAGVLLFPDVDQALLPSGIPAAEPHAIFYNLMLLLVPVGVCSLLNQFFRGKAYSLVTKPSSLAPIIYFSVLVSVFLDAVVFKHTPSTETVFGGVLILMGSYLVTRYKIKKA